MGDALDITALGAVPGPPEENDVLDITALGAISPPEDDDVLDLFEEGAIDPRFSAYLPDGKVMPGGRLDPNRSEAELEQLQQELAERGDRLSPFELSLLYRHRTNKPITEQAAEGMTTLFSGLAQVGRALFGLPGELSGKERDPLALQVGRALTPLTGVLQLASERMRADPSTRLHELTDFKFT